MTGLLRMLAAAAAFLAALPCSAEEPPEVGAEAPRVRAMLEQAWSAESGKGYSLDARLALAIYCHAGLSGSAEAFYRIGRLLVAGPSDVRNVLKGRGYLALAAQLGNLRAADMLDDVPAFAPEPDDCSDFEYAMESGRFDMPRYIAGLPPHKRAVAEIIVADAAKFDVPPALALAVACAESNFDSRAVSPKNAQGVMQLIPDTQKRFGVTQPFDAKQNVHGGLRYIKWLLGRFAGNVSHVVAAYNAGEGNVLRYRGIPPFSETRAYVRRVLFYAGMGSSPPGESRGKVAPRKR